MGLIIGSVGSMWIWIDPVNPVCLLIGDKIFRLSPDQSIVFTLKILSSEERELRGLDIRSPQTGISLYYECRKGKRNEKKIG